MAALVGSLALAAPAGAQFDPFHRQAAPPADIPGDPNEATGLVLRINRLEEELRQANGRIEQLENSERRLEEQLQRFRQDVNSASANAPTRVRRGRTPPSLPRL